MSRPSSEPIAWETLDRWLRSLYSPSLPPPIEHDPSTQQQLSKLYRLDLPAQHILSAVNRLQTQAVSEYTRLANTYHTILLPVTITAPATRSLTELSKLASQLHLPNMRLETFELAVASATIQGYKNQTQLETLETEQETVSRRIRESKERQQKLKRLLEARQKAVVVEAQKAREWTRNSEIIGKKTEEYRQRLGVLKDSAVDVRRRGVEFQQIKQLDAAVNELAMAVNAKRQAHSSYSELPPDTKLAWIRLEEARQALMQLQAECERAAERAYDS